MNSRCSADVYEQQQLNKQKYEQMNRWTSEHISKQTNQQMNKWTGEQMYTRKTKRFVIIIIIIIAIIIIVIIIILSRATDCKYRLILS